MPSKNPAQRLRDIADNIDAIGAFTAGMEIEAFAVDRKTLYAVVRALEIVSAASRRLPAELMIGTPKSTGSPWPRRGTSIGTNTRAWTSG